MKTHHQLVILMIALLSFAVAKGSATIKNAKTETAKVYGNCEQCKSRIEAAGYKKGVVKVTWNISTKVLTMIYNSQKTTTDEILKRVAYAGYDNEMYKSPDDTYAQLPACCQYERSKKTTAVKVVAKLEQKEVSQIDTTKRKPEMTETPSKQESTKSDTHIVPVHLLGDVYAYYFSLKSALAKDNGKNATLYGAALYKAIDNVAIDKMSTAQHTVWMKYEKQLSYDAEHIKSTIDIDHEREHFITLSKNMYAVMKTIKPDLPVYYDFCPMANDGKGATWVSQEEKISNPYLGSKMPTCGKVQETVK